MAKPLGVTMIQMYEGMIKADFDPLVTRLEARTAMVRTEVDRQVKVDMGVYALYEEKAALTVRVNELTREIADAERQVYDKSAGNFVSPIAKEVNRRLAIANTPLTEVRDVRDSLLRSIKLAGVGGDVKSTFDALPGLLKELSGKYGDLDPLTADEFHQLTAGDVPSLSTDE